MKAVVDEAVPRRLARLLPSHGHDVSSFPNAWKGLKNGQLLFCVEDAGYSYLLTCDKSMRFQQNIEAMGVGFVVLPAQHFDELVSILSDVVAAVRAVEPGKVLVIGLPETLRR